MGRDNQFNLYVIKDTAYSAYKNIFQSIHTCGEWGCQKQGLGRAEFYVASGNRMLVKPCFHEHEIVPIVIDVVNLKVSMVIGKPMPRDLSFK